MKKKLLLFIFSLCILLPSALMLTACSRMKVEFDLTERGVVLSPMDSDNNASTWAVYNGFTDVHRNKTVAVWLEDWYDKDTLKVYIDDKEIQLTSALSAEEDAEYDEKKIGTNNRRVATFVVPGDLKGNHKLRVEVEEEKLNIKFHNINDLTEENKTILSTYKLVSNDEANGVDFLTLVTDADYRDYVLKMPFTDLIMNFPEICANNGLKYTCTEKMGKYNGYYFLTPYNTETGEAYDIYTVDPNLPVPPVRCDARGIVNENCFAMHISPNCDDNFNGNGRSIIEFERRDIDLTFDTNALRYEQRYITGKNAYNSILSRGTIEADLEDNDKDVKVYFNRLTGVNFDNLKVYIYDTEMDVLSDSNGKYIVIPKDKYPVDYCEHITYNRVYDGYDKYDWLYFDPNSFDIIIKGVQIDESKFNDCVGKINGEESPDLINVYGVNVYYQDYNNKTYKSSTGNATIIYNLNSYLTPDPKTLTIGAYTLDLSEMAVYNNEAFVEKFKGTIYTQKDQSYDEKDDNETGDYAVAIDNDEGGSEYYYLFQDSSHFANSPIKQIKIHFAKGTGVTNSEEHIITFEVTAIEIVLEVNGNIVVDLTIEGQSIYE